MAIPTSRTKEKGIISINTALCNGCGLCVSVCKDFNLVIEDEKVRESSTSFFGCIACGHCMAICPADAIAVSGRTLSPADLFTLPEKSSITGYEQLMALLQCRRSIREFTGQEIEPGIIQKILDAAGTAPMGIPPSDVNVMIIHGKKKQGPLQRIFQTT